MFRTSDRSCVWKRFSVIQSSMSFCMDTTHLLVIMYQPAPWISRKDALTVNMSQQLPCFSCTLKLSNLTALYIFHIKCGLRSKSDIHVDVSFCCHGRLQSGLQQERSRVWSLAKAWNNHTERTHTRSLLLLLRPAVRDKTEICLTLHCECVLIYY